MKNKNIHNLVNKIESSYKKSCNETYDKNSYQDIFKLINENKNTLIRYRFISYFIKVLCFLSPILVALVLDVIIQGIYYMLHYDTKSFNEIYNHFNRNDLKSLILPSALFLYLSYNIIYNFFERILTNLFHVHDYIYSELPPSILLSKFLQKKEVKVSRVEGRRSMVLNIDPSIYCKIYKENGTFDHGYMELYESYYVTYKGYKICIFPIDGVIYSTKTKTVTIQQEMNSHGNPMGAGRTKKVTENISTCIEGIFIDCDNNYINIFSKIALLIETNYTDKYASRDVKELLELNECFGFKGFFYPFSIRVPLYSYTYLKKQNNKISKWIEKQIDQPIEIYESLLKLKEAGLRVRYEGKFLFRDIFMVGNPKTGWQECHNICEIPNLAVTLLKDHPLKN